MRSPRCRWTPLPCSADTGERTECRRRACQFRNYTTLNSQLTLNSQPPKRQSQEARFEFLGFSPSEFLPLGVLGVASLGVSCGVGSCGVGNFLWSGAVTVVAARN